MSSSTAVKRKNSLETRSAILRTKQYPCATIAIREDISSKRVDTSLPTRKVEQRNTAKAAITVERVRTIGIIANPSVTILTTALTTIGRERREEMTINTAWENQEILNSLVVIAVDQRIIENLTVLKSKRLLTRKTASTCSDNDDLDVGEYGGLDVINADNAGGEDVNQLEGVDV
jgi:hypothetical protein